MSNKRGRPTLNPGEPSSSLHVTLPNSDRDKLDRLALRQNIPTAEVARRLLRRPIKRQKFIGPGKALQNPGYDEDQED